MAVRLAVQFQSILDAFTSHDTVFAFSSAEELSESALGLNTILKSGSKTSSSSSLRQQRLKEIVEDNEEPSNAETMSKSHFHSDVTTTPVVQEDSSELPASATRAKAMLAQRRSESTQSAALVAPLEQEPETTPAVEQRHETTIQEPEDIVGLNQYPPRTSSFSTDKVLPVPPEEAGSPVSLNRIVSAYQRPSLDFSVPNVESDSDDDFRRPMPKEYHQVPLSNHLTATESSNISRWTDEVVASTRSKQKRGSKPHNDNQARPKTSSTNEDNLASRRVANLPSSVRISNRAPSQQSSRPGSQQSARSMPGKFVPSPNLPPPLPSPTMPESPEQRVHGKSRSQASSFAENQAVAPEKLRLMKALQMRKRNQLLAQRSTSAGSATIATMNSIDSSSSHSSTSMAPQDSAQKRKEPPALDNLEVPITTSPISLMTVSDTQSTKPSSISEQSPANHSSTSLSSDTNSSTTPKADDEEKPSRDLSPPIQSGPEQISSTHQIVTTSQKNLDKPLPQLVPEIPREQGLNESVDHDSTSVRGTKKRYQFEGRINIPPSTTDPSDISDDESFMEELQNATVQEAKPMSVNRTPMTPVLAKVPIRDGRDWTPVSPNGLKSRTTSHSSQASTPDKRPIPSRAGSTRSLSTALPQWPPVPTEPVPALPKQRPQISAGIVTRVKTFESLGLKETASLPPPTPREPSSRMSSFSNMLKRASVISHVHHSDKSEKVANISPSFPSPPDLESDEESDRANSRPIVQRPGTSAEVYMPVHKGESVSITARIVRDTDKPHTAHGSADARDMHWSPLIVEHQKPGDPTRPHLPRELTTKSADSLPTSLQERRRFSFSSHKAATKSLSPTESKSHRLSSAGSHKKSSRAASESSSITDEKKGSRASRMLKRLSALGMSKPKNKETPLTSPTYEISHQETITEQGEILDPLAMRTVVDIGEVNVQFPETLLWKRRFLRVDDQGFLIFAAPVNDSRTTHGKSRKIHLDELLRPALPDREREQMAWSIVLDLKTGGTVQCACENGNAQRSFLKSKSYQTFH